MMFTIRKWLVWLSFQAPGVAQDPAISTDKALKKPTFNMDMIGFVCQTNCTF